MRRHRERFFESTLDKTSIRYYRKVPKHARYARDKREKVGTIYSGARYMSLRDTVGRGYPVFD
jgi:hypothetical protein